MKTLLILSLLSLISCSEKNALDDCEHIYHGYKSTHFPKPFKGIENGYIIPIIGCSGKIEIFVERYQYDDICEYPVELEWDYKNDEAVKPYGFSISGLNIEESQQFTCYRERRKLLKLKTLDDYPHKIKTDSGYIIVDDVRKVEYYK